MSCLDLSLAEPKIRKVLISRYLRSVLKELVYKKSLEIQMIRLQFFNTKSLRLGFCQTKNFNTDLKKREIETFLIFGASMLRSADEI